MPRRAILWKHPRVDEIIGAIKDGQSKREMQRRFGIGLAAINTFMREYGAREEPDTDKAMQELADMDMAPEDVSDNLPTTRIYGGVDIMEEMLAMKATAERLQRQAESADKLPQAISALREQMRIFEVMMKMAQEMRKRGEYNPWAHPDVIAYQEGMIEILRKHPTALEDILEYIERFSSRSEGSNKKGKSE